MMTKLFAHGVTALVLTALVPSLAASQSRPQTSPPLGHAVPRGTPPSTVPPSPPPPTGGSPLASALFDPTAIQDLYLTVNTRDWVQLKEEFRENTYYLADMRWRDQVVRNVGIRSRGSGSRSGSKPGLKVDFNEYSAGQEFLGLKSLVLDNFLQDPSMIRERIAMLLFEEMGIRAPRETHARLFVNNEYVGLYAIVESIDKQFLKRQLGENDGYLYEFNWKDVPYNFEYLGSDLEPYAEHFQAQTHETESMATLFRPIREMVWAFSESPSSQFLTLASEQMDLEKLMSYIAIENFIADADGILGNWGMNNFYLYRFEDSSRHQLIPWDKDSSFRSTTYDIWDKIDTNVLVRRAMEEGGLRGAYAAALQRCAEIAMRTDSTGQGWLERQVTFMTSQIREAAAADPVKPYSNAQMESALGGMLEFARQRPQFVLRELGVQSTVESVRR
jgi:spore coat protein CotH